MSQPIKQYEDGKFLVKEYSSGSVLKTLIQPTPSQIEPQPTIEEQILAELQYNTALTEMNMLGGI